MIQLFSSEQNIIDTSRVDMASLKAISRFKDLFVERCEEPGTTIMIDPEVADSWRRSREMEIDSQMQELPYR
ncbi:MAG: hypothetical protein GX958_03340 [Desulfitobacterium sp.]|nr:hypothetical protein [Desulfitobacterium sp.]